MRGCECPMTLLLQDLEHWQEGNWNLTVTKHDVQPARSLGWGSRNPLCDLGECGDINCQVLRKQFLEATGGRSMTLSMRMPNRSWHICVAHSFFYKIYNASLWFPTWCIGPGALYRFRAGSEGVRGDFVNFCTKHIEDQFLSVRQSRDDGLVSLGNNLDKIISS